MKKEKYRFPIIILSFVLLFEGVFLQYKGNKSAWAFVGIAVALYLFARIFLRNKPKDKE